MGTLVCKTILSISPTRHWAFFFNFVFLKKNWGMNQTETNFQNLAILSHAICTGVTYGVDAWPSADVAPRWPDYYGAIDRHVPSDVDRVTPCWAAWLTKESCQPPWRDSSTEYGSPSSSLSLFFPSPLLTLRRLHWRFQVLPHNPSHWCKKSTLWVGILILLGTYVVFTILFCCILKFSFGWTHVAGIRDEINVFVISM
jgi:hypothetical protein